MPRTVDYSKSSSEWYPRPKYFISEDGMPTIDLNDNIQILTEDGRIYYKKQIENNLNIKSERFRVIFEFEISENGDH